MEKKLIFPLVDFELSLPRLLALIALSKTTTVKNKKKKTIAAIRSVFSRINEEWYSMDARIANTNEDELLIQSVYFEYYIRRGLTFIVGQSTKDIIEANMKYDISMWEIVTEKLSANPAYVARCGFPKFFDLNPSFLTKDIKNSLLNEGKYIFSAVHHNLKNGVTIIKTRKANGENAQISYCKKLSCWVVSSKNVSMFIKDPNKIENTDSRYQYCIQIAQVWFMQIKHLNETQIQSLINILDECTFIGEYVGPEHQHLIKYDTDKIIFYCITKKGALEPCNDPLDSFEVFKQYGLPIVPYQNLGVFDDWEKMRAFLIDYSITVNESTLNSEEEGVVLYFTAFKITLSMCKLKTMEYRIYRKLRQHLKSKGKHNSYGDILISFKENYRKLNQELLGKLYKEKGIEAEPRLPHSLDYYDAVASEACLQAQNAEGTNVLVKYVAFIGIILI